MSDTMRDAFEAWIAKDCGDLSKFGSGQHVHYRNSAVNNAWAGWQAAQSQPAPPVPSSVQEIMPLLNAYVRVCQMHAIDGITAQPFERLERDMAQRETALQSLQAALTALVDERDRLKFELDGVNAMRRPLSDERILAGVKEFADENYFANYQEDILRCVRSLFDHGTEPEQGESHAK